MGGSRSADRSCRLGVGSLVLVDVLKIEIIHTSLWWLGGSGTSAVCTGRSKDARADMATKVGRRDVVVGNRWPRLYTRPKLRQD